MDDGRRCERGVGNGATDRVEWLERPGEDFPYYDGRPVAIAGPRWWIVMLEVAAGLAILVLPPLPTWGDRRAGAGDPLCGAFARGAGPGGGGAWTAIFRPLRGRDVLLMIGFAVLNLAVTLVVGKLIIELMGRPAQHDKERVGPASGVDDRKMRRTTDYVSFGPLTDARENGSG